MTMVGLCLILLVRPIPPFPILLFLVSRSSTLLLTNLILRNGYDQISVAMLQSCAFEVSIPLQLIFQKCIFSGMFPDYWKYANVQPIHKKGARQLKTNYMPISLLPICGKILEKIVFDHVYSFLNINNLISKNQ